jgi:hypothetical protein
MIKSKMVTLLKQRLGNREDLDIEQRIDDELDMAQYELEHFGDFTPWFLLSSQQTVALTAGIQAVSIPTDMIAEWEEGVLFYEGTPLTKYDFAELEGKYYESENGPPEAYSLVDDTFIVFPVPDDAYMLRYRYYARDTEPSNVGDDEENKWMKHAANWLLAKAGVGLSSYIKDEQALALFSADLQRAEVAVYKSHIRRVEESVERNMGDY